MHFMPCSVPLRGNGCNETSLHGLRQVCHDTCCTSMRAHGALSGLSLSAFLLCRVHSKSNWTVCMRRFQFHSAVLTPIPFLQTSYSTTRRCMCAQACGILSTGDMAIENWSRCRTCGERLQSIIRVIKSGSSLD